MNIKNYENKIIEWDMYPDSIKPTIYILGILGELGEALEKILEYYERFANLEKRQLKIALEIGDIYWYLFRFMNALGFTYSEVIKMQVEIKNKGTLTNLLRIVVEVGKISNKFKKVFRDHGGILEKNQQEYIIPIAKIFKYLESLLDQMDFTFEEIIEMNYEKLDSRFKRNKIKGGGDAR